MKHDTSVEAGWLLTCRNVDLDRSPHPHLADTSAGTTLAARWNYRPRALASIARCLHMEAAVDDIRPSA